MQPKNKQAEDILNLAGETLTLGGRQWRILQRFTLEHVIWMDRQVIEAGLDRIARLAAETEEQFAARIWRQIATTEKALHLLSGILLPAELKDEEWTPLIAAHSVAAFKKITDPVEQRAVRTQLAALVLYFFVHGLGSFASTGTASGKKTEAAAPEKNGGNNSSTSAPGAASSAS